METETEVVDSPQTETLADVSTNDLRDALINESPQGDSGAEETSYDGQEAPPQETEEEIPGSMPEEDSEEERLAKRRIRPRSELDQQVMDLYRSEGFSGSMAEASSVIYGQTIQPEIPRAEAQARRPSPLAGYDIKSDDLRKEIAELEEKVQEAAENMETSEALSLQRDVMRREMEIQRLGDQKERYIERARESEASHHRSRAEASRDNALSVHPELSDRDSVYRKQFDHYVGEKQNDPDYAAIFQSPKWPEMLANEFAMATGNLPATQGQALQAPEQRAPQMGTQARVLTSGATAQPTNAPFSQETFMQHLPQAKTGDLYAMLGQPDGSRPLR